MGEAPGSPLLCSPMPIVFPLRFPELLLWALSGFLMSRIKN